MPSAPSARWRRKSILRGFSGHRTTSKRQLRFKNDLCQRLRRRVRDTERNALDTELARDLSGFSIQPDRRPAATFPHDFEVHPAHAPPPAGPQRFHRGFLRGEAPGVALILVPELLAILPLRHREHAPQERFAVSLDGGPNTLHFRDVHSHPDDQRPSAKPSPPLGNAFPKNAYNNWFMPQTKTKPA